VKLHEIAAPEGSRRRRHRVGRGIAGKGGKTAGRGSKGQRARGSVPVGFAGGQLPLTQAIPKLRGFKNPFRIAYTPVNLDALEALGKDEVDPEALVSAGLLRKGDLVKVLGRGRLSRQIRVSAHAFSASAEAAITAAGGSVERVPLPFGHGRPPVRGNALANR
jgi:large subunit ribosomal protein L15